LKFQARTNDKREIEVRWDLVNTYLSRWKPGTYLNLEITRRQTKKSDPMRRFYFASVLPPFMKHLGYEKDEELFFHHQLKIRYFEHEYEIYQDERGIWKNVPSVFGNDSEMPISKKHEFVEWVIRKAAHEGVYIEKEE